MCNEAVIDCEIAERHCIEYFIMLFNFFDKNFRVMRKIIYKFKI